MMEEQSEPKTNQGPSQAKLRLESMTASVDHKLAAAFTVILLMYSVVTFGTLMHIESQTITSPLPLSRVENVKPIDHADNNSAPDTKAVLKLPKSPEEVKEEEIKEYAAKVAEAAPSMRVEDIPDIETLQHTFPFKAGDDLEEIEHPGIKFADQKKFEAIAEANKGLNRDPKIKVPKFFRPKAYGPGGVREFLGEHGKRLITPEEASKIGSFYNDMETIYISVASYRDPECMPTVEDMFLRADHPERLRVAIIDQRAEDDVVHPCNRPARPCGINPDQAMCKYAHLIDEFGIDAPLSVGPVFARHLANRMYRGEYFAMQVDSHVRFTEHWDTDIIQQWKSAKNEMAVLSVYLSDINKSIDPVTHENKHPMRPIMCKTDYEGKGKLRHLRHGQQPEGLPGIHGEPTLHPFWAAGFSFARGHFVIQVPYDQYQPMVFQGEEIFQGLRGFTYGYDYYTPETSVAFHMYAIKENKSKRKKVKLFWENSNLYPGSAVEGMKRLNGIIGMGDPNDEYYHGDEDEYGLGQARKKEKFYELFGIHTDTQKVEDHLCQFVGKPMQQLFIPFLRENGMGLDLDALDFHWLDPKKKGGREDVQKQIDKNLTGRKKKNVKPVVAALHNKKIEEIRQRLHERNQE